MLLYLTELLLDKGYVTSNSILHNNNKDYLPMICDYHALYSSVHKISDFRDNNSGASCNLTSTRVNSQGVRASVNIPKVMCHTVLGNGTATPAKLRLF